MKLKIISSCVCPVGSAAYHDADELRANLLEGDRILCVSCGCVYPKMSKRFVQIYRAIASEYGVPKTKVGSETEAGTREYDMSCLCGYDPAQSDRVEATFSCKGESVRLLHDESSQGELENSNIDEKVEGENAGVIELSAEQRAKLSTRMTKTIAELEKLGFRTRHFSEDSMGLRVLMVAGRKVGSMGYVKGATAELRRA